jgi:hypothetical protein
MAINSLQLNGSSPFAGLGTSLYNVLTAGPYTVAITSTIPQNSGLQIVINQNSTPIVTIGGIASNPTPTQESMGTSANLQCAVNDVISVVLSSSAIADQAPNAVKSVINLFQVL